MGAAGGVQGYQKYDRHGKADFVSKILLEIEKLGGRFLLREGTGQFILAPDKLKKTIVQHSLICKAKGSKRSVPSLVMAYASLSCGGPSVGKDIEEVELVSSSFPPVEKATDEDEIFSGSSLGEPLIGKATDVDVP